jgi:hypothetical protein
MLSPWCKRPRFAHAHAQTHTYTYTHTHTTTGRVIASGAFAKLRKATISFLMTVRLSVRPSVCMEQLGSHWKNFVKFDEYFSKICPEN